MRGFVAIKTDLTFVEIPAGSFLMGQADGGDYDERPVHLVNLSRPFRMATTPVTNAQYEQFRPEHRKYRGLRGVSVEDQDAVTYVSWHDAVAFCEWLTKKEGKPHRLPTEAEWEYACRSGTTTAFHTGNELPAEYHRNQPVEGSWAKEGPAKDEDLRAKKGKVPVSLAAGKSPANAWGLYDMHGMVEEWCHDWYGAYESQTQTDPVGRASGLFKVARGGSHNTYIRHLRSANRLGAFPKDKHWIIGFRVVRSELPATAPLPSEAPDWNDETVKTQPASWSLPNQDKPVFEEPIVFVNREDLDEELAGLTHNHHPDICWCPNGDMLAVWFSTRSEIGREMRIVSSRLRRGATSWEPARRFFSAPDRNNTGSTLFNNGQGRLFFFGTVSESSHHHDQLMYVITSDDSGRRWSPQRIISSLNDRHKYSPLSSVFTAMDGSLVLTMDTAPLGYNANECGAGVFVSPDGGETWIDRISGKGPPETGEGRSGSLIAGFHATIVQLKDGRLFALARTFPAGDTMPINGRMPQSVSSDMGQTWTYSASPFPTIGQGQRPVLLRLAEGPVLFVSFCNTDGDQPFRGKGIFAALSYDECETWPIRRLLTFCDEPRPMDAGAHVGPFVMSKIQAEPGGYLAITQSPDGIIHLTSSRNHYRFNLAWLQQNRV